MRLAAEQVAVSSVGKEVLQKWPGVRGAEAGAGGLCPSQPVEESGSWRWWGGQQQGSL